MNSVLFPIVIVLFGLVCAIWFFFHIILLEDRAKRRRAKSSVQNYWYLKWLEFVFISMVISFWKGKIQNGSETIQSAHFYLNDDYSTIFVIGSLIVNIITFVRMWMLWKSFRLKYSFKRTGFWILIWLLLKKMLR